MNNPYGVPDWLYVIMNGAVKLIVLLVFLVCLYLLGTIILKAIGGWARKRLAEQKAREALEAYCKYDVGQLGSMLRPNEIRELYKLKTYDELTTEEFFQKYQEAYREFEEHRKTDGEVSPG